MALVNPERLRRILTKMLDEASSWARMAFALFPSSTSSTRTFSQRWPGAPSGLPARGVEHGHVRRELQLAGTRLDAGERSHSPCAAELLLYYGDNFKIECPTGSGNLMNLFEVAGKSRTGSPGFSCATRWPTTRLWQHGKVPERSVLARQHLLLRILPWRQWCGLGASHQTGWTGLVAKLIELYGFLDAKRSLEVGRRIAYTEIGLKSRTAKAKAGGLPDATGFAGRQLSFCNARNVLTTDRFHKPNSEIE